MRQAKPCVSLWLDAMLAIAPILLMPAVRAEESGATASSRPAAIRDILWVWGNPEMTQPGPHTPATFAQASPLERAQLLGVPNIVMAGLGLPSDDRKARDLMRHVGGAPRIVWEIMPEGEQSKEPFDYRDSIARIRRLTADYPRIQGVLLDDMSTVKIDRGFKPTHIRQIRELLGELKGSDLNGWTFFGPFDDLPGFVHLQTQWLHATDVVAGVDGVEHHLGVQVIGRAHVDDPMLPQLGEGLPVQRGEGFVQRGCRGIGIGRERLVREHLLQMLQDARVQSADGNLIDLAKPTLLE